MSADPSPEEPGLPVQQNDTIPPEPYGQSSDTPLSADHTMNGFRGRARHVSPCMRFATLSVLLIVVLVSLASTKPLYALMFAFLALLPAGIAAKFIMTKLKDDAVSESFLVNQFLIGAIPLSILVVLVELIIGAILILAIFWEELSTVSQALAGGGIADGTFPANTTEPANNTTSRGLEHSSIQLGVSEPASFRLSLSNPILTHLGIGGKTLPDSMVETAPLWKIILFLLLNAFLVAGLVEETGKWVVSRRYREINADPSSVEFGRTVGCRGILAACSMGALGFATIENLAYVVGLSTTKSEGFPFALVALALLRGILAFPIHIGAQFYIGIAAAQKFIFDDPSRILRALFLAVMLHGSFDAAALVFGFFIGEERWPDWTMAIVLAFQLCMVAFLMLLCRGRYKALLERERMVLPSQDDV